MSAVLALPLIAIFLKSLRVNSSWTLAGWRQIETRPIINSLMFAVATTGIAVVVGIATACAIAYNKRAANVLPTLASLPLVISAVILGLGIIITFDQSPIEFRGSIWLLPVVHSLVALPLVFRVILPAINLVPTNIRGAASTMGAPPSRVWLTTDWPAIRRVLPLAASLSASVSLGEFGATSVLSRRDSQTMPMAISQLLGRPGDLNQLKAYALSALLVLIIAAIFFSLDTANA